MVTESFLESVNLASTEYPPEVDEIKKSGLTPLPSDLITPPRIAESPFQCECKLHQIVSFGKQKSAGNLMICEILKIHIQPSLLQQEQIDPNQIQLVGRLGSSFYCCTQGNALFSLPKPSQLAIGFEALPQWIRDSEILSAKDLVQLASIEQLPNKEGTLQSKKKKNQNKERRIKKLITEKKIHSAWKLILACNNTPHQ